MSESHSHSLTAMWIAIMGVLTLVISFVWEWGYWSVFGISFWEIPMSIENLAGAILAWVPSLGVPLFLLGIVFLVLWIKENEINKKKNPGRSSRRGDVFIGLVLCVILLYFAVDAIVNLFWGRIGLYSIFMAIIIVLVVFSEKDFFGDKIVPFFSILALFFYFHLEGRRTAINTVKDAPPRAYVHLIAGNAIRKHNVTILRHNENFIFTYNPNEGKLTIVPWKIIASVTFDSEPGDNYINIPFFFNEDEDQNEVPVRPLPRAPTPRH